jgi:hypothetical protein
MNLWRLAKMLAMIKGQLDRKKVEIANMGSKALIWFPAQTKEKRDWRILTNRLAKISIKGLAKDSRLRKTLSEGLESPPPISDI